MQVIELNESKPISVFKKPFVKDSEYRMSDEMKKDLENWKAGRDLIGPFDNLDDLWKKLGI